MLLIIDLGASAGEPAAGAMYTPMNMRLLLLLSAALPLLAQGPSKSVNPLVKKILEQVSQQRIEGTLKKLEAFGTRGNFSATDHPTRGIGAARRWIFEEMKSYSPKLEVRMDTYRVKKQTRIFRDVELVNVVAMLPGKRYSDQQIIISGHYDSLNLLRRRTPETTDSQTAGEPSQEEQEKRAIAPAPGVSDDASGVAATMELARVLSAYEFDKTLVFIAFAGEEIGLVGSSLHAQKSKEQKVAIEAVLNSDIIGTEVSGDGRRINRAVRVFSDDPNDSPSRQLARYIKEVGERYWPKFEPWLIFRSDRVGRGGDHTPFALEGYAAVRFTSAVENYTHQHSETDTFENASPEYTTNVARLKAVVAASLAMAPKSPVTVTETTRDGQRRATTMVTRGRSQYDALLRWKDPDPAPDLAGYVIVSKSTISPLWEKEVFAGKDLEYLMPGVDIDTHVFGVKAIDLQGNESLIAPFAPPSAYQQRRKIETY